MALDTSGACAGALPVIRAHTGDLVRRADGATTPTAGRGRRAQLRSLGYPRLCPHAAGTLA